MRASILIALLLLGTIHTPVAGAEDVAPVLKGVTHYRAPIFPIELRGVMNGSGNVVMAVTIDTQGKVIDSVALQATEETYVTSVNRAIADWQFEPAVSNTWPRREILEFDFKRSGVVTSISHVEAAREWFASPGTAKVKTMQWKELDTEPQKILSRAPTVSSAMLRKYGDKLLLVNFIIDSQGQVHVPVVHAAEDSELVQAVLTAVQQWRFSPPMYKGEAVSVEVTRALVLPSAASSSN